MSYGHFSWVFKNTHLQGFDLNTASLRIRIRNWFLRFSLIQPIVLKQSLIVSSIVFWRKYSLEFLIKYTLVYYMRVLTVLITSSTYEGYFVQKSGDSFDRNCRLRSRGNERCIFCLPWELQIMQNSAFILFTKYLSCFSLQDNLFILATYLKYLRICYQKMYAVLHNFVRRWSAPPPPPPPPHRQLLKELMKFKNCQWILLLAWWRLRSIKIFQMSSTLSKVIGEETFTL